MLKAVLLILRLKMTPLHHKLISTVLFCLSMDDLLVFGLLFFGQLFYLGFGHLFFRHLIWVFSLNDTICLYMLKHLFLTLLDPHICDCMNTILSEDL